jgi:predicted membrane channel-forming protein YqfA (hemolysin III family)
VFSRSKPFTYTSVALLLGLFGVIVVIVWMERFDWSVAFACNMAWLAWFGLHEH